MLMGSNTMMARRLLTTRCDTTVGGTVDRRLR